MKVLLLSDTHGSVHPGILDLAATVDLVVHAGDVGHPTVLTALQDRAGELRAVRGNNDRPERWPADAIAAFDALAPQLQLPLPDGLVVVEHGHRVNPAARRHEKLRKRHPDARLIVYGHSHHLAIDRDASPWIVNPGAAGRARTHGGPSCILLTIDTRGWHLSSRRFALADWDPPAQVTGQ